MTNPVASLATIPLAAPSRDAQAPQMYRLGKSLAAVQFDLKAKGRIVFLPEGAELRVVGASCLYKCFEVACENRRYNIFQEDLLGPWAMPIKSSRTRSGRGRAMGACA